MVLALMAAGMHNVLSSPPKLTDAADTFDRSLADIMERIRAENAKVMAGHPDAYATIVALLPMSGDAAETGLGLDSIRHALQGAHLAQLWRNADPSAAPYIRLLVGSITSDEWEDTVEELERRVESERITGVIGLGNSVDATKRVIGRLSQTKIAMVAAVITSDELQGHEALVRVAPLNSDQAEAAVRFAERAVPALKPVTVTDTNSRDSYSKSLSESFENTLASVVVAKHRSRPLTFDSSVKSAGTVIGNIADKICDSDANTVFYAARSRHLPTLLQGLSRSRPCVERGMTVIAGDDASEISKPVKDPRWADSGGKIRLYRTALAHGANVSDPDSRVLDAIKARFGAKDTKGYARLFGAEPLDDGHAIMHHDALYLTIKAIDRYARDLDELGPEEVAAMLRSGTVSVDGASGRIEIGHDGNSLRREVPILRLDPYGNTSFAQWASPQPATHR
ncbi:hypothetical protein E1267_32905 [Nonomuraea longispora]|uniref:Receptor ligand binding region domain-containing protein n=1 Tax=Nonomuraea longispora TaxID=1848320 RepID=A0A4R4N2V7_9ACTN|nr:hypothetical protein [Nonomuraea longispora]TDC01087.1 hypothetical protein E1267_32905 [Nonomuraea longispora]